MPFTPNPKQISALTLMGGDQTHTLLYGGSRCLSGDAVLDGHRLTIRELAEIGRPVRVLTSHGYQMAEAPFRKGRAALVTIDTSDGRSVTVTPDHRFWDGRQWLRAEQLLIGSPLAVRVSGQILPASISGACPSMSPADDRRSTGTPAGSMGHCSTCRHPDDARPRQVATVAQGDRASRPAALVHIHEGRRDERSGSGSHAAHHAPPGPAHSHPCRPSPLLPMTDAGSDPRSGGPSQHLAAAHIFAPSLGTRSAPRRSALRSSLLRSSHPAADNCCAQCAPSSVPYDTPDAAGYGLATVTRITTAANQDYYTLHVPGCEHYFANGVLHHNSGKSFLIVRTIIVRAMHVPYSRHLMARFRLSHIRGSLVAETMPNVLRACFPQLEPDIEHVKGEGFYRMPNGSEIWYAGLDDKDRTEKILGKEFATVFLNECSQIPWASRNLLITRLAQKTYLPNPNYVPDGTQGPEHLPGLKLRAFYDENPPLKTHWTYKVFIERKSPDTNRLLADNGNYASQRINPVDNKANIADGYLEELNNLPERVRKRFRDGEFGEPGEGALWTEELLEQQRILNDADLPGFTRIVIGVDPSGARDAEDMHRDEIGIVVVGLGDDGHGYVLEDLTMKGSPAEWGLAVVKAYLRWGADRIVAEENFGGAMVKSVIDSAAANLSRETNTVVRVSYTAVTASRGKIVRAEPVSALYEQQEVWHVDGLQALENELTLMTTAGYLGDRSPNRADACVWALTALFHLVVKAAKAEASSKGTPPTTNLGHAAFKKRMAARRR